MCAGPSCVIRFSYPSPCLGLNVLVVRFAAGPESSKTTQLVLLILLGLEEFEQLSDRFGARILEISLML